MKYIALMCGLWRSEKNWWAAGVPKESLRSVISCLALPRKEGEF